MAQNTQRAPRPTPEDLALKSNRVSNSGMTRHSFPEDLVATQTAWYVTYGRLANEHNSGASEQRRRLLQLSRQIARHRFWQTPAGTPAARVALKELARAEAAGEQP